MEFKYPSPKCDPSPVGAHYYVSSDDYLWRCKYCDALMALPKDFHDAHKLSELMRRQGLNKGYNEWLESNPQIKELLQKAVHEE